jgi:hypothetical protein
MLLGQHGPDQADDRVAAREDPDHVRAAAPPADRLQTLRDKLVRGAGPIAFLIIPAAVAYATLTARSPAPSRSERCRIALIAVSLVALAPGVVGDAPSCSAHTPRTCGTTPRRRSRPWSSVPSSRRAADRGVPTRPGDRRAVRPRADHLTREPGRRAVPRRPGYGRLPARGERLARRCCAQSAARRSWPFPAWLIGHEHLRDRGPVDPRQPHAGGGTER